MIKGDIYITDNINILRQYSVDPSIQVVFLDEETDVDQQLLNITNGICGGALLPDPMSVLLQVEQGIEPFEQNYFNYLNMFEPTSLVLILLKVLCNGRNILLYVDPAHADRFLPSLLKYFKLFWGLSIGILGSNIPSVFDINFIPKISEMLYLYDLCTINELFLYVPSGYHFTQNVIIKLSNEVNPYISNSMPTLEEYEKYFYNYKEQVKNKGKFLKTIVRRG